MSEAHFPDYLLETNQRATPENIALYRAAEEGDIVKVRELLNNVEVSCDFFYHPQEHKNALHIASEKGYDDVVELLLSPRHGKNGANPNALAAASQNSALHFAALNNKIEVVKLLLRAGAKIDAENGYGNTPLHEACREGFLELVKIFIENGANPRIVNHKGSSALHFACYGESQSQHPIEIVRALLDAGCGVDVKDNSGFTPFLVCCTTGRLDIMTLLRERGADITVRDNDGRDAHDIASFNKQDHVASLYGHDSPARRFRH